VLACSVSESECERPDGREGRDECLKTESWVWRWRGM
jgi:hypothetical protein